MKFWNPFKPKNATLKEPEWWKQNILAGSQSSAGITVTQENAMQVSTVFACIRLIAETVASLPLKMYRSEGSNTNVDPAHPLTLLLGVAPNGEQTAMDAREFIMTNVLNRGNGYAQQIRNARGQVVEINTLNSRYMHVDRDGSGRLVFDYQEPGNNRVFTQNNLWRVSGLSFDGVTGKSPISLAREAIGTSMAMEQHGGKVFANGLHTNLIMEYPHALDDEQYERLKTHIDNSGGLTNTGRPFLAESGMKITQVGMNNDDAQFLESRKFSVNDVARWFKVPPHMIGDLEKATFSNIEHQSIEFVVHTIRPWLVRIEQTIWRDLLNASEKRIYQAKHSVEGLLRGDTASRYAAYGQGIQDGWLNRNEVRAKEDLNSVEGLDDYLLPMNMDQVSEREARLVDNVSNHLSGLEVKALAYEWDKNPAKFEDWLPNYYARFCERMQSEFGIEQRSAEQYALEHIKLFEDREAKDAINYIEQHAQQQIAGIIK